MLLLLADSFLLFFITMNVGILTRNLLEKIFRCTIVSDLLGIFLLGLIFSSVYFNIFSFWLPVNYLSLIPLAILSLVVFFTNRDKMLSMGRSIRYQWQYFRLPAAGLHVNAHWSRLLIFFSVLVVFFVYWVLPPANADSRTYHYLSILWYEKYKVVPGLVNVFGCFAFNPVSFIIQAAYSFTGPAGQSLYPLNGVLVGLLLMWLLVRLFKAKSAGIAFAYLVLIVILYRPMLINISSPSSDVLVIVCVTYPLVRLLEFILSKNITVPHVLVPMLIILYSLIAKLSSFPVLMILPFILYWLPGKKFSGAFFWKVFVIALLLYIPWLGRNYIMSGYLVYPFPYLDLFHPDWKAPPDVMKLDIFYINVVPKLNGQAAILQTPGAHLSWLFPWLLYFFRNHSPLDPAIFILAILSPLYWIIPFRGKAKIDKRAWVLWLVTYGAVWIWLITSPVIRFGASILALAIVFPFFTMAYDDFERKRQGWYRTVLSMLFIAASVYYVRAAYIKPTTYPFTLADCWLFPLKDYTYKNDNAGFPYRVLRGGVKLYVADGTHHCMNAGLPCMVLDYAKIEMRGDRLDQGFRTTSDRIRSLCPFIK